MASKVQQVAISKGVKKKAHMTWHWQRN